MAIWGTEASRKGSFILKENIFFIIGYNVNPDFHVHLE